jgi:hypothetical protein
MDPDERRQHFDDGGAIVRGIDGDALQGVDAAESHVQLGVAELVDGAGEPFGDLALLRSLELVAVGLELSVGEVGAEQEHGPADALQQGGADVVDGPSLVGGGKPVRLSAELPPYEPLRDDQDAGQHDQQGHQTGELPAEAHQPMADEVPQASDNADLLV